MVNFAHGGDIYSREIKYDFSANLNPLGMPKSVKDVLKKSVDDWESYPDPFCNSLRSSISESENIPAQNIVCGNGAADLVYRIVTAVNPKKALIVAPTFSEYEKALEQNGTQILRHYLKVEDEFLADETILDKIDSGIDILFICSPNNPTGKTVPKLILKEIAKKCMEKGTVFVCDECFLPFVTGALEKSARSFLNENVIILNAFTKIYAMAGLRLGYAFFGSATLAEKVSKTGQFWSVSTPAQIAGIVALGEKNYIEETVQFIKKEREFLTEQLHKIGIRTFTSEANFILFKSEKQLDEFLLKEKIAIRNCSNYIGLSEGYFRIAVRTRTENEALILALRRCLNG